MPYRFLLFSLLYFTPTLVFAQPVRDPDQLLKEAERLFLLDNWVRARPLFAEAERLFIERGDGRNALFAKISRLRADSDTISSYPEVSRLLAGELRKPLVQNDLRLKLRALVVKATADLSINDPARSGAEWSEALVVAKELHDKFWEERATCELGIVSFLKGDPAKAVEQNQKAYELAVALHDVAGQMRARSLRGVGLLEQGQHEQAMICFDEVLELAKNNPDARFPLMAYMGKSQALEIEGRPRESRELLEEAWHFVDQTNMSVYKADLLIALGTRAVKAKHVPEAINLFEQAAAAAQKAGMPRPFADATFQVTDLLVRSGDYPGAERKVIKGLAASRRLVDMYFLPRHLAVAAEIETHLAKTTKANAYYDEAEDLVESMLVNVPSASVKSALIATMSRIYIGHFRLALEMEHNVPKAFRILERARGRVVADRLRARPLWKEEASTQTAPIENKLAGIQNRLLHATTAEQRKQLMQELNRADLELAPVALARYRSELNINGSPVTLTKLQRSLRRDEVLLEFVIDDPQSFCLAISKDRVRPYVLEGRSKLDSLIAAYIAETKDPSPSSASNRVAAQRLYQALLQPIEERNKARFIIVPDEKLNFVRFGSLVTPGGEYVVQRHVTTYTPSATVLNLIKTQVPSRQGALPLLAFGDPTAPDNRTEDLPKGALTRGVFDLEGATFGSLPSAAAEIRAITQIVGPRSRVFLGSSATEAAFKSEPLAKYRVLHFAAHAVSDQRFPDRSAVVLAADQGGDDGLLQVREIRDLHLNADLVTLSACDTGTGKLQGLDGISSVVSAFLFAGSKAVLATAWSVDDAFTASLMTRYYSHLAAGEDTGTALQQAKLDLLKRFGDKATPYYWSGFFLSGDGNRKISFQR